MPNANGQIAVCAKCGVQETSINWFKSYLHNRTQVVKIGEVTSNELQNNLELQQGKWLWRGWAVWLFGCCPVVANASTYRCLVVILINNKSNLWYK